MRASERDLLEEFGASGGVGCGRTARGRLTFPSSRRGRIFGIRESGAKLEPCQRARLNTWSCFSSSRTSHSVRVSKSGRPRHEVSDAAVVSCLAWLFLGGPSTEIAQEPDSLSPRVGRSRSGHRARAKTKDGRARDLSLDGREGVAVEGACASRWCNLPAFDAIVTFLIAEAAQARPRAPHAEQSRKHAVLVPISVAHPKIAETNRPARDGRNHLFSTTERVGRWSTPPLPEFPSA